MDISLDDWFANEILVHEGALMRYLQRCWYQRDEIPDLRQDIYVRVYEAAAKARPARSKTRVKGLAPTSVTSLRSSRGSV